MLGYYNLSQAREGKCQYQSAWIPTDESAEQFITNAITCFGFPTDYYADDRWAFASFSFGDLTIGCEWAVSSLIVISQEIAELVKA